MTKILSFDISSISTGVALFDDGYLVIESLSTIKPNPRAKNYGERLSYFENNLRDIIKKYKPDVVSIEDIFKGRNMNTFKSLAMFRGVAIKLIFQETGRDPISMSASEARSILKIGPAKEDVFKVLVDKYKLDFNFDQHNDIVDAIALGEATKILIERDKNEGLIRNTGSKKRRKRAGNKERVSKASASVSSRQKPRKQRGRGKI